LAGGGQAGDGVLPPTHP